MSELVIVESPAKAKTIQKYLGSGFEVVASMGHVRDLPKSKLSVDIEHNFEPTYIEMKGKEDVIKDLRSRAKKSSRVWLATDPDREGEAISWHLAQLLGLDIEQNNRVEFNEITKTGVQAGMSHPHKIDLDLVNAQQARRILDRIVGYQLSPFLWRKIRRGLSAGRVQSVAVRLVVDRENEIRAFQPREYWSVDAKMTAKSSRKVFSAHLAEIGGKKAELATGAEADAILKSLDHAEYTVKSVKKRVTSRQPAPPFITSTLQQEASRRMGFQARRTMKAAQELYEGVEIPELGAVGLITYMRTDSLRISDEAKAAAADYIREAYGKQYLPAAPRSFKTKKGAQDAHEAIRPTMPNLTPDRVKNSLTQDQYKLYKLIWERFIASQMANSQLDTVSAEITANDCLFRASGYSVKFDGFTRLYVEAKDGAQSEEENKELPPLTEGEQLKLKSITGNQHFTQPPSRYTEATLIKAMEENGIGRPSTYAATVGTILSRMYVERDGKQLRPTSLGEVTTELMKDQFKQIVDVKFTAEMESDLDGVEQGETDWVESLRKFYDGFEKTLSSAEKAMDGKRLRVPDEETDEVCELCGKPMVIKIGRFGKFLACSGFPDCRNTKKIVTPTKGFCPVCGKKIILKKSKKGRSFYGCEGYPECTFMTWSTPVEDRCPKCGNTLFKKGGRAGKLVCEKPDCGYERPL
ncbi:MAG: type I DNA topoisomerase [Oscillospiraceae bacterium]|nr:type I DNA topoisomerase [Oscillospiraceae bacterium]